MSTSKRIKYQLAAYAGIVAAVLVLVGVAMIGAAGYSYINPPTEEIPPQQVDTQEFTVSIQHSADVVGSNPLYGPPATLENQPVYFINSTPELRLEAVAAVPSDRPVNVSHELMLYREASFREEVFFNEEEMLASETTVVEDGEMRIETTLDMASVVDRTNEIANTIQGTGTSTVGIRLQTSYETSSVEGGQYEGTLSIQSEFAFSDRAYWLTADELQSSQTESQTIEASVQESSPNYQLITVLVISGLLVITIGSRVALWGRGVDLTELETDVDRSRYEEWISQGDFPTDSGKQYIYISSLEDLVDIAIDSGKRVIYDPELDTYGVLDNDMVYYHSSDPTTIDSWVNFARDES